MAAITSITVTAKTGPAGQVTAQVFNDAYAFRANVPAQTLEISRSSIPNPEIFDLNGVTTFTVTISSTNYAIVIS